MVKFKQLSTGQKAIHVLGWIGAANLALVAVGYVTNVGGVKDKVNAAKDAIKTPEQAKVSGYCYQ